MKPASNQLLNISYKLEILLDIGSSNESFYYLDGNNLGAEVGDIVSVRLRGRLLNGFVISKKNFSIINNAEANITREKSIRSVSYTHLRAHETGRSFFEFSVNDQSFMSPLRAGYLQCAKNTLWNVQQSNTKKKF